MEAKSPVSATTVVPELYDMKIQMYREIKSTRSNTDGKEARNETMTSQRIVLGTGGERKLTP